MEDRAIWVGNEFYHKLLLEYFTAVYYYEQCFDDYDELANQDGFRSLFDHYNDPYWSVVLQMFLIKADSCADAENTEALYGEVLKLGITDFTLLFDTCQKLLFHKEAVQKTLLTDILECSATKVYPPYGPLFWYVPEYDLYGTLLSTLESLQDKSCFTNALALARDVCWIFGKYHTAEAVSSRIDGKKLLENANLPGIRKGLCELFYGGSTDCADGNDIYLRCFNLAEVRRWKAEGIGIYGSMNTAFEDELGLYSHEMLQPFGEEWAGIVSTEYDIARIEEILTTRSCSKLCGLFLSPGKDTELQQLAINDKHLRRVYLPENICLAQQTTQRQFNYAGIYTDSNGVMYVYDKLIFPDGITKIGDWAFEGCSSLTSISIPDSVTEIGAFAFYGCSSLSSVKIPERVTEIGWGAFNDCSSLISVTIPDSVTEIGSYAFMNCSSLTSIRLPDLLRCIGQAAFAGCTILTHISNCPAFCDQKWLGVSDACVIDYRAEFPSEIVFQSETEIVAKEFYNRMDIFHLTIPNGVTKIGDSAFYGCSFLTSISIPDSVTKIESSAFEDCSSLASVTIPDSVTEIEWCSFSNCSSLTSIVIPKSVRFIGGSAFSGCIGLQKITLSRRFEEDFSRIFPSVDLSNVKITWH